MDQKGLATSKNSSEWRMYHVYKTTNSLKYKKRRIRISANNTTVAFIILNLFTTDLKLNSAHEYNMFKSTMLYSTYTYLILVFALNYFIWAKARDAQKNYQVNY